MFFVIMCPSVFNVWPKTVLSVWPRDAKRLDTPGKEMDKFLETYNLPRVNYEEIKHLSKAITSKEIEPVLNKPSNNKKAQK